MTSRKNSPGRRFTGTEKNCFRMAAISPLKATLRKSKRKRGLFCSNLRFFQSGMSCQKSKGNQMELTIEVKGMKAFKGVIDGKEIDSGTVYSRVRLNAQHNDQGKNFKGGETVEEWKMPNAKTVFDMQHMSYPFICKLEVERVSNGSESKEMVLSATAVEPAVQRGAPAASQLKAA